MSQKYSRVTNIKYLMLRTDTVFHFTQNTVSSDERY